MIKILEVKNKILNFDVKDVINIFLQNFFLIAFLTLLGFVSGYFIVNQETAAKKFELTIKIPEHDYRAKQNLIFLNDKLDRVQRLERETLLLRSLSQSKMIPELPKDLTKKTIFEITTEDLLDIILEYTKDRSLYEETKLIYNDKVRSEFSEKEELDKYLIKSRISPLSLLETNNPEVSVRIFFAETYSDYLVDNFAKIYLQNMIKLVEAALNEKFDIIFDRYNYEREQILNYIIFSLRDTVSAEASKQERIDAMVLNVLTNNIMTGVQMDENTKEKIEKEATDIINLVDKRSEGNFAKIMEKIGTLFLDRSEYFDSINTNFDYFYQSSNIDKSYKNRYRHRIILQDNNNIFTFGILGFVLGLIISFIRYSFQKK